MNSVLGLSAAKDVQLHPYRVQFTPVRARVIYKQEPEKWQKGKQ